MRTEEDNGDGDEEDKDEKNDNGRGGRGGGLKKTIIREMKKRKIREKGR